MFAQQFDAVGAQTPARTFGGEGALKDLQLHLLRHVTLVVHPELQVVFDLFAAETDYRLRGRGLDGILGHVDQDAVQESRVGGKLCGHGIGGYCNPVALIVASIIVQGSYLVKQGKAAVPGWFGMVAAVISLVGGRGLFRLKRKEE